MALIPLALLSGAWTVALAGVVPDPTEKDTATALPDGTVVPAEAYEQPTSYAPFAVSRAVTRGAAGQVVRTASVNGIPSAALAAYQRAETVLDAADKACNIPWQLIAAIGRVESDHGRYGGSSLGPDGVSRPGIYGIALDGTNNTAEITDTDAGQFDNDKVFDRAVGPMQFIPSTWSMVGVDADGDSERNPQDIDDAALASGVYLCSGPSDQLGGNLSQVEGQRKAIFRYNHSEAYVDLVLSIMNAYQQGDYASVPNHVTSAVTFTPDYGTTRPTQSKGTRAAAAPAAPAKGGTATVTSPPATTPKPTTGSAPTVDPATDSVTTITGTVEQVTGPVLDPVLSLVQATLQCTAQGLTPLLSGQQWNDCINDLTH